MVNPVVGCLSVVHWESIAQAKNMLFLLPPVKDGIVTHSMKKGIAVCFADSLPPLTFPAPNQYLGKKHMDSLILPFW